MQNKETLDLTKGQYTENATSDIMGILASIPAKMMLKDKAFYHDHSVKLMEAKTIEDDKDEESALWYLHFQGFDIYLNNIDEHFLTLISEAWDMNGIDSVFESIHLDHHRKDPMKNPLDDLYITIRGYC